MKEQELDELVNRLTIRGHGPLEGGLFTDTLSACSQASAAIQSLREQVKDAQKRIEELEEALKVFADEATRYDPPEDDDYQRLWDVRITIGDLRKAARALNTPKEAGDAR